MSLKLSVIGSSQQATYDFLRVFYCNTSCIISYIYYQLFYWPWTRLAGAGFIHGGQCDWCQLHWLPVIYRVKFKLCCIIHAIYHDHSPTYLSEAVQSVSASRSRSGLRSTSTSLMDYALPRLRTSSASVLSLMQVQLLGTHCRTTSELWSSQI